jgi:hypothetical protein
MRSAYIWMYLTFRGPAFYGQFAVSGGILAPSCDSIGLVIIVRGRRGTTANGFSIYTTTRLSAASSKVERDGEQRFRAIPDAKNVHANMKLLAPHPHNVGSEAQRKNAEWMVEQYKKWGWDAKIEQFDVLYPMPKTMVLELVGPTKFRAKLDEPPLADDPYTHEKKTQLPGYNIYSADGDVTGPLVYANYGMPDDYLELERNNISVKGAIVITRYGGGWRGLKPKLAYEHGAIGCIIYSDPADDGYGQNDVLPKGQIRSPDAAGCSGGLGGWAISRGQGAVGDRIECPGC